MYKPEYDEYMEHGGKVKEIESVDEAKALLKFMSICKGCDSCPVRMYEKRKGDSCRDVKKKAEKFLEDRGVDFDDLYKNQYECRKEANFFIFEHLLSCGNFNSTQTAKEKPRKGTCAECLNGWMHPSGIRWCADFHNFVHEDGYCYRFKGSDKMEETPVDNS